METNKTLKDILYTGVFFQTPEIEELMKYVPQSFKDREGYREIAEPHVTTGFGSNISLRVLNQALNLTTPYAVNVRVVALGISDTNIALKVKYMIYCDEVNLDMRNLYSDNKVMHITLATANGGKPVDSNKIEFWQAIEPFDIVGTYVIKYRK